MLREDKTPTFMRKIYQNPTINITAFIMGPICGDLFSGTGNANGGQQLPGGGTQAPKRNVF